MLRLPTRPLNETTFVDTYGALNTPENLQMHVAPNFNLPQIERELQRQELVCFVVESENRLIAFAKLVLNRATKSLESPRAFGWHCLIEWRQGYTENTGK